MLDHIDDDDVRALAIPGLALRRITAEVVRENNAQGHLGPVCPDRARELFGKLRRETVVATGEGDVLVHRADVRPDILPLLASEDPDGVASLHRYAIRFYSKRDTVADRTEELYHRLALGQATRTLDRRWDDEAGGQARCRPRRATPASQAYLATQLDVEANPAALRAAGDEAWASQGDPVREGLPQRGQSARRPGHPAAARAERHRVRSRRPRGGTLARLGRPADAQKLVGQARDAASEAGNTPEFVRFSLLGAQIAEDAGRFPRAVTLLTEAHEQARASGDVIEFPGRRGQLSPGAAPERPPGNQAGPGAAG